MITDLSLCDSNLESYLEFYSMGIQAIQSIFPRSDIRNDDKLLWVYLVTCCIQNQSAHCVSSYQELAKKMNWKIDTIYLSLQKLKLWGFLSSNIPFSRGTVTVSEAKQQRTLSPSLPEQKITPPSASSPINLLHPRLKQKNDPRDKTCHLHENKLIFQPLQDRKTIDE